MRILFCLSSAFALMAVIFWAYQENYKTQAALAHVRSLHHDIGLAHERLAMLRAEWAYLNRPDRLMGLADIHFDRLGLSHMMPDAFGEVDHIIYPTPTVPSASGEIEVSYDPAAVLDADQ